MKKEKLKMENRVLKAFFNEMIDNYVEKLLFDDNPKKEKEKIPKRFNILYFFGILISIFFIINSLINSLDFVIL